MLRIKKTKKQTHTYKDKTKKGLKILLIIMECSFFKKTQYNEKFADCNNEMWEHVFVQLQSKSNGLSFSF